MAESRNQGVFADPLFVGITRPAMALGVTYGAALANGMLTVELFLLTRNLLALLVCLPVHGILWILCAVEPRFFELLLLFLKTRRWHLGTRAAYRAATYAVLASRGTRRTPNLNLPVHVGERP
ncbi:MAG: VirB3 family type IV secretion system protein [Cyanobacteria bacterium SZAS LIN-2]|nr:VirB3 family type IV secretion system protein [Cyanobacteria bacterium SZAS LIN-2]